MRRQQQHVRIRLVTNHGFHCAEQGLGFHYHPAAAAKRPIVDLPMSIERKVAQIMHIYLNETCLDRSPNNAKVKDLAEDLGKDRDYVEPYH